MRKLIALLFNINVLIYAKAIYPLGSFNLNSTFVTFDLQGIAYNIQF